MKWVAVGLLVAVPTIGLAVTKYRAHQGCPNANKEDCPYKRHK
jgi:hypothetical protein